MPYADPQRAEEANRRYWRERGHVYRANRTPPAPPVSRRQALDEDVAQATALAELEGRRIGRKRALERLEQWVAGERRWISATSSGYRIGEEPHGGD